MSKILGTIDANGNPVYPEVSISGRPYKGAALLKYVPDGFVVLDHDADPNFDYAAAVKALGGTWNIAADETALTKAEALALAAGRGMSVNSKTTLDAAQSFIAATPVVDAPVKDAPDASGQS